MLNTIANFTRTHYIHLFATLMKLPTVKLLPARGCSCSGCCDLWASLVSVIVLYVFPTSSMLQVCPAVDSMLDDILRSPTWTGTWDNIAPVLSNVKILPDKIKAPAQSHAVESSSFQTAHFPSLWSHGAGFWNSLWIAQWLLTRHPSWFWGRNEKHNQAFTHHQARCADRVCSLAVAC